MFEKYWLTFIIFMSPIYCFSNTIVSEEKFFNKYFLADFLEKTYGPSVKKIVNSKIITRSDLFAGACDPYSVMYHNKKVYREEHRCFNGMYGITASALSKKSALRTLLLNEICEKISTDKHALKYSLGGKIPPYNLVNVKKYAQHFKIRIDQNLLSMIIKEKKEPWIFTSKIFCRSDRWQKP